MVKLRLPCREDRHRKYFRNYHQHDETGEVEVANAGDIVVFTKLQTSLTGDTLAEKVDVSLYEMPKFPKPYEIGRASCRERV